MVRLNESDTDSDMPYLIGPPEIQHLLDAHAAGIEGTTVNPSGSVGDVDTASWLGPLEIQEMVDRQNAVAEDGFPLRWQRI